MRRLSSDQRAAIFAGTEIAIAFLRGQTPELSQQWEWAVNPGFLNEDQKRTLVAMAHPDDTVVGHVRAIVAELQGSGGFSPGLRTDFVYLRKP
jgi:hypothetical protein